MKVKTKIIFRPLALIFFIAMICAGPGLKQAPSLKLIMARITGRRRLLTITAFLR